MTRSGFSMTAHELLDAYVSARLAFLSAAFFSLAAVPYAGAAGPVTSCGETVGGAGFLTADLDCSAFSEPGGAVAIELVDDASLDLAGFTLRAPQIDGASVAVLCKGDCTVSGGTIDGGGTAGGTAIAMPVGAKALLVASDVDVTGIARGIRAARAIVTDSTIVGNGQGHAGLNIKYGVQIENTAISGFEVGVSAQKAKVRGSSVHLNTWQGIDTASYNGAAKIESSTITDNGAGAEPSNAQIGYYGGGVRGRKIRIKDSTVTGNAIYGVQAHVKAVAVSSTITDNTGDADCFATQICADVWSAREPRVKDGDCSLSLDMSFGECLEPGPPPTCPIVDPTGHTWGVCSQD